MEWDRYEKAYRDAREVLSLRGKNLGQPILRGDVRYCALEGLLLTDREIFTEAWTDEIADELIDEREIVAGDAESCSECARLLVACFRTNNTYVEILRLRAESGALRLWSSSDVIESNRGKRDAARQALMEHTKAHRGLAATASLV